MLNAAYTIVDVETTGGSPATNRIIEIGILRVERGRVVSKYKSFINPGMPIPEFITTFTGITDAQVKKAPTFSDIAEEVLMLFEDSIFVAHNSNFDYQFLRSEFRRAGFGFTMPTLCTVRLSRVLFPQYKKHNLSAIIERFSIVCKHRHRAFDDAQVLWEFIQRLPKEFSAEYLATTVLRTMKKIPPKVQQKLALQGEADIEYIYEES